jgi:hypothetical protein
MFGPTYDSLSLSIFLLELLVGHDSKNLEDTQALNRCEISYEKRCARARGPGGLDVPNHSPTQAWETGTLL